MFSGAKQLIRVFLMVSKRGVFGQISFYQTKFLVCVKNSKAKVEFIIGRKPLQVLQALTMNLL